MFCVPGHFWSAWRDGRNGNCRATGKITAHNWRTIDCNEVNCLIRPIYLLDVLLQNKQLLFKNKTKFTCMVLILLAGCISLKGPAGNEGSIGVPGRPGRKVTKLLRCYVTDDVFSSSFGSPFVRNSSKFF